MLEDSPLRVLVGKTPCIRALCDVAEEQFSMCLPYFLVVAVCKDGICIEDKILLPSTGEQLTDIIARCRREFPQRNLSEVFVKPVDEKLYLITAVH